MATSKRAKSETAERTDVDQVGSLTQFVFNDAVPDASIVQPFFSATLPQVNELIEVAGEGIAGKSQWRVERIRWLLEGERLIRVFDLKPSDPPPERKKGKPRTATYH